MKKTLKYLVIYGFSLPIIFNILGGLLKPEKIKYLIMYPLSYVLELLMKGVFIVIPYIVLMLLTYNNLLKKEPTDKEYIIHKIATIVAIFSTVLTTTFGVLINFMYSYFSFKSKPYTAIAFWGTFPITSALLVLIMYGLVLFIGRLLMFRCFMKKV